MGGGGGGGSAKFWFSFVQLWVSRGCWFVSLWEGEGCKVLVFLYTAVDE